MSLTHSLSQRAEIFARKAHGTQLRSQSMTDFLLVDHLVAVVALIEKHCPSEEAKTLGWLHDVVEDTKTSLKEIERNFGATIASHVQWLTDPAYFAKMASSWDRKLAQATRIRLAPAVAQRVKVADQLANAASLAWSWPSHWSLDEGISYLRGSHLVVQACAVACPDEMLKEFQQVMESTIAYREKERAPEVQPEVLMASPGLDLLTPKAA